MRQTTNLLGDQLAILEKEQGAQASVDRKCPVSRQSPVPVLLQSHFEQLSTTTITSEDPGQLGSKGCPMRHNYHNLAPSRDVVKELDVSVPSKEIVGDEEEENVTLGVYLGWGLLSGQ